MTRRVFLVGEGATELGSRGGDPVYQHDGRPGMLERLMACVRPDGWTIARARQWKSFRKLQVGVRGSHRDEKNVVAAALDAKENACDVLVFSRDRDREVERQAAVDRGIARSTAAFAIVIGGGVAIETIEAWILALGGHTRTESLSRDAAKKAAASGADVQDLERIPEDAASLRVWLERVAAALTAT